MQATHRRLANLERLTLIERVDAWSVLIWDLVFAGRYAQAIDAYRDAEKTRRAGESEYSLGHAAAWSALAAMLCGRWDEALRLGDTLIHMREESQQRLGRFTFPGWMAALHVATARSDATRVARFRSAAIATADFDTLTEPNRSAWTALLERDAVAAHRFLKGALNAPDRRGEILAMLVFDLGERPCEEDLASVEHDAAGKPPVLTLRIQLARAVNDHAALRSLLVDLDAASHVADAARAAALLALRTRNEPDRADARRRLEALGDRLFLQKLEEEWT